MYTVLPKKVKESIVVVVVVVVVFEIQSRLVVELPIMGLNNPRRQKLTGSRKLMMNKVELPGPA